MDLLRGVAVLLIVLYHANPLTGTSLGYAVDHFFQPYRVPLLLVLSGMLLPGSLGRGVKAYAGGKLRRILWPLFVWTLVMLPFTLDDYLRSSNFVASLILGTHLWFLWVLLFAYGLGLLVKVVHPLIVAALLWGVALWVPVPAVIHAFTRYAPYFFLGAAVAPWIGRVREIQFPRGLILLLGLVAVGGGVYHVQTGLELSLSLVFVSLCGIATFIWLGVRLPRTKVTEFMEWCGRNSIVIYVAHFPVQALFPPFFGTNSPSGKTLGLITSLVVCYLLVRYRHLSPWLYEWPGGTSRTRARIFISAPDKGLE